MASDGGNSATVAAINATVSSAENPYSPPEERSWKVIWARYWCFKSQKRDKRIVPAARSEGASGSAREWPAAQNGLALAPPSSPASFVNSTVQSPASFTLSLSAVSASMCSPGRPNTMFTIGPYANETQLVSPPVFSTFTTEPSTAPLTPPPELAHLTTPSSPDVPFAHYVTSSLEAKCAGRDTVSPLSTSNLASPCDTPVSYTPTSSHYYLGSPVGRLVSPMPGHSSGEVMPSERYPLHASASGAHVASSFPSYDPHASANFDSVPFAAFILPSDTITKCEEHCLSLLVQPDPAHENCGGSSHNGIDGITVSEHGVSSSHEEVAQTVVHNSSNISLQKDDRPAFEVFQVKVDLQQHLVASPCSVPIMDRHSNGTVRNQDTSRVERSCSGVMPGEVIKKGEKLQELFAHDRNEVVFSAAKSVESKCEFSEYQRENVQRSCAKAGIHGRDEGLSSNCETGWRDNFLCSSDPLFQVEMRPVIFKLDDVLEY